MLLVDLYNRGWDFPGGHIELNKTPEEYIIVDHNDNPKWSEKCKYPKFGFQVIYQMKIKQFHDFEGRYVSARRILINPNEVTAYYHGWHSVYQSILDYAIDKDL